MLYRLEEPIYFYLFAIIPVIIVIFLLVSLWKKRTQKKFASSGLLSKLAPNISVFKSILKLSFFLIGISFLILALINPKIGTKLKTVKREGVDVVMDSVGQSTFEGSLNCLKPLGMMITFGNASGPIPPFNLGQLGAKGSLKITRPTLFTHIGNHNVCQEMAKNLFAKVTSGQIDIIIGQKFPLSDVALAHDSLEQRMTTGSTILTM